VRPFPVRWFGSTPPLRQNGAPIAVVQARRGGSCGSRKATFLQADSIRAFWETGRSRSRRSMAPGGGSRMESIMGRARFDPGYDNRRPWNAGTGRLVGAKRPFKVKQIWAIRFHLDHDAAQGSRHARPRHRQQVTWLRSGETEDWRCRQRWLSEATRNHHPAEDRQADSVRDRRAGAIKPFRLARKKGRDAG
jgi:hypothetical protein